MTKKNTMLTLERDVVKRGRILGLNFSKIAENAISEKIEKFSKPTGKNIVRIPKTDSISVTNFGTFKEHLEIKFKPGINVIVGPSGSGKTTLLHCLKATYYNNLSPPKSVFIDDEKDIRIKVKPRRGTIESRYRGSKIRTLDSVKKEKYYSMQGNKLDFAPRHDIWNRLSYYKDEYIKGELLHDVNEYSRGEKDYIDIVLEGALTFPYECYIKDDIFYYLDENLIDKVINFLLFQEFQCIVTTSRQIEERKAINIIELEKESVFTFWEDILKKRYNDI